MQEIYNVGERNDMASIGSRPNVIDPETSSSSLCYCIISMSTTINLTAARAKPQQPIDDFEYK